MCGDTDRAGTGTASAVRCGEGLMQIEVKHIKSHITGTYYTHQRIHIGSVIVKESSTCMYKLCYLLYILFEQTQGVRIGHHDTCNGIVKQRLQVFHIHKTCGI